MTAQEAIKALELNGGLEINGNAIRVARFFQGLDVAIKALEKQIPKKPIKHIAEQDWYECTACGAYDVYEQGYCDECGQKLDWGE